MTTMQRCAATIPGPDRKLRCTLPARHDKNIWHQAKDGPVEARWNDQGSAHIEFPTHRGAK